MWRMEGGRSGGVASGTEGGRGEWRSCEGGGMERGDFAAIAAGEPTGMEPPSVA